MSTIILHNKLSDILNLRLTKLLFPVYSCAAMLCMLKLNLSLTYTSVGDGAASWGGAD